MTKYKINCVLIIKQTSKYQGIMIYHHCHLTPKFLQNKTILKINKDSPLMVILSETNTFLNKFILGCLNFKSIPYHLQYTTQSTIMSYQLPAIAFNNYFLTKEALVEFFCDIMLNGQKIEVFIERKTLLKDQYLKWHSILKEEAEGRTSYSNLHGLDIKNQQDYFNHIVSQLVSISSWITSDILAGKYRNFNRNEISLQTLWMHELTSSIIGLCPSTLIDHILRSNFQALIQYSCQFESLHSNVLKPLEQNQKQVQIVVNKQEPPKVNQFANTKLNGKRFALVVGLMVAVYVKWVE